MIKEKIAENPHEFVSIDYRDKIEYMAIRVGDNYLSDSGINAGDVIIVHKQNYVENGDLALTYRAGRACVRKVSYNPDEEIMVLYTSNPEYPPVIIEGRETEDLLILGRVVEVRKFFISGGGGQFNRLIKKKAVLFWGTAFNKNN
nr:MAG TPA: SOS regulatory protein LexA [Caudoviricetes sp.]